MTKMSLHYTQLHSLSLSFYVIYETKNVIYIVTTCEAELVVSVSSMTIGNTNWIILKYLYNLVSGHGLCLNFKYKNELV